MNLRGVPLVAHPSWLEITKVMLLLFVIISYQLKLHVCCVCYQHNYLWWDSSYWRYRQKVQNCHELGQRVAADVFWWRILHSAHNADLKSVQKDVVKLGRSDHDIFLVYVRITFHDTSTMTSCASRRHERIRDVMGKQKGFQHCEDGIRDSK